MIAVCHRLNYRPQRPMVKLQVVSRQILGHVSWPVTPLSDGIATCRSTIDEHYGSLGSAKECLLITF